MRYSLTKEGNSEATTVKISGEMTIYAVKNLFDELLDILNTTKLLTLNLSQVTAIDSSGMQLLIFLKKQATNLKLLSHSKAVLKYLDIYGLTGFFGDPVAIKKSEKDNFSFQYGLKKHPEKP